MYRFRNDDKEKSVLSRYIYASDTNSHTVH